MPTVSSMTETPAYAPGDTLYAVTGGNSRKLLTMRVANIAAMTAILVPTNGMSVEVTEEHRGGFFVFDTSVTAAGNTGTTFSAGDATSGSWVRQYNGPVHFAWFGPDDTGATDVFTKLQAVLTDHRDIVIDEGGTYLIQDAISLFSNTRVRAWGVTFNFDCPADPNCMLGVDAITGLDWEGGTFVSVTPADNQSCFVIRNSATHNRVVAEKIQNFRNKGMIVITNCSHCYIQCFDVSGSTGTDGVGFSIHGAFPNDCTYCTIGPSWAHSCRAGFTFNGGKYNSMLSPLATDCSLLGITLDGVVGDGVTGDGDGPKYCYIENPVAVNCTAASAAYGGFFIGNGANWNTIVGGKFSDNLGNGVRTSGYATPGAGAENNVFIGTVCSNNLNGFQLSLAKNCQLIGCIAKDNSGEGISVFSSDNVQVIGGRADNNGAHGLLFQSSGCATFGFHSTGNGSYGIRASTGGTGDATNKFYACSSSGNTTADYLFNAGGTVRDCEGYVNEASGTAVLLSGNNSVIVTHGLSYTPALKDIQISSTTNPTSLSGYWFGSLTSTTFTIASSNSAGANITFAWHARQV